MRTIARGAALRIVTVRLKYGARTAARDSPGNYEGFTFRNSTQSPRS
jgi:hypothetical protein